ncbi:MAG: ferrous iron transport protein B, partial [Anaerolineae bacterium]
MTVALTGNPNVGKSTIFNALTGTRQHVGNWPGKTIEKKEGLARVGDQDVLIVDLPGIYSLPAFSVEESIARSYILDESPEMVVVVMDAANLERNLYLLMQVMELSLPAVAVLNMADIARSRGITVDTAALSQRLRIPVVEMVGSRGIGLDELKAAIGQELVAPGSPVTYPPAVEAAIEAVAAHIPEENPRWRAIKLLEGDTGVTAAQPAIDAAGDYAAQVMVEAGDEADVIIADSRYQTIATLLDGVLTRPDVAPQTFSDKVDRILTHRLWGVPIFMLMLWVVFLITAIVSAPFLDFVDGVFSGPITHWAQGLLNVVGLGESWLAALLIDGLIAGVGGVLVFVPVLMSLYIALGLLEDSGYMARAAFVMDRVMRTMGLQGKSFLPMMVGFGCSVPAVYATRTLANEDDRRLTGFLVPFMSCGARLPVYVLFGAAFFGTMSGSLVFGMYVLGIGVALITGLAMKHTVFKNKPPQPFVMELPPYRLPDMRTVLRQTWDRTKGFIEGAGTTIVIASMAVWLLTAIPVRGGAQFNDVPTEDSLFASVSRVAAPVFSPAGFGDWEAAGSLFSGLVAIEVVISTMSQIYLGADEGGE